MYSHSLTGLSYRNLSRCSQGWSWNPRKILPRTLSAGYRKSPPKPCPLLSKKSFNDTLEITRKTLFKVIAIGPRILQQRRLNATLQERGGVAKTWRDLNTE